MAHLPIHRRSSDDSQRADLENVLRQLPSGPPVQYVEIESGNDAGDEFAKWLRYWQVLSRRKLLLLAASAVGALFAFILTLYQTPIYITGSTLEFSQASDRQPFEGISFLSSWDSSQLQTQAQLLRSSTLQSRVHAKLSAEPPEERLVPLDPLGFARRWLGLSSHAGASEWEDGLWAARSGVTVTPETGTRIVRITVESTIPEAAASYANTLAQEFIEQNLEERWQLYQSTGAWLDKAKELLKSRLEESEKKLLDYAGASGLIVTSRVENIAEQRLLDVQAELSRAQAERIGKESVYRTAMARPAAPLGELLDGGPMGQYEVRLADLRRELAEATTSLTDAHPRVRRLQAQIDELEAAQSRERNNILSRIRSEYETALHREQQLVARFENQTKVLSEQDEKFIRYRMFQREVDTYRTLYDTTLQRGEEASLASALRPVSARLVDPAWPPLAPSKPNLPRNMSMGVFAGLMLGVALVLVRDRADASIREPGSMGLATNLRELGVIPSAEADPSLLLGGSRKRSAFLPASRRAGRLARASDEPVELAAWNRRDSLTAESFRATLTSILMSGQNGHDRRVILVTSPSPGEGKSTVVTNLAVALAEIRQRVLLIDADLRRPRVHSIFGQVNTWGLSDLLREQTPYSDYQVEALARKTRVPGLFSLPSGSRSGSASRLLHTARMGELIDRLRTEFDAILIDSPPVLSVADGRVVSRLVDAVVLVVRAGHTRREAATMAAHLLEADGVPVIGTVLNDWDSRRTGSGYYAADYLQHYYADAPSNG